MSGIQYFPGEQEAIGAVLAYGEAYGYGNLISHLQNAWSAKLQAQGIPKHAADMGAWKIRAFSDENDELKVELASAKAVIEALRSVLSEDGVREHLAAYVMGVETMNRLDEFDARSK